MHGFTHPITAIDHVLAMVAVGMLAAQLGGRALSRRVVQAGAGAMALFGLAVLTGFIL